MQTDYNTLAAKLAELKQFAVTRETYEARIATCRACGWWREHRCGICNCPMETKAAITATQCPDNPPKWPSVTSEQAQWLFGNPGNVVRLKSELESWRGTRFSQAIGRNAKKGVACDCVSFVASVLINLKAIGPFAWPGYVTHSGGAAMLDLLLKTLGSIPKLKPLDFGMPPMPGDLYVISSGTALHHLAIYAGDNTLWHAVAPGGVATVSVCDPLATKHTVAIFRATT